MTPEEIQKMRDLVDEVIDGKIKMLIIHGPPLIGKTTEVLKKLHGHRVRRCVGRITAGYLFRIMEEAAHDAEILLFDDNPTITLENVHLLNMAIDPTNDYLVQYDKKKINFRPGIIAIVSDTEPETDLLHEANGFRPVLDKAKVFCILGALNY